MAMHDEVKLWRLTHVNLYCSCEKGKIFSHAIIQMLDFTSCDKTAYFLACPNCDRCLRVVIPFASKYFDTLAIKILAHEENESWVQ